MNTLSKLGYTYTSSYTIFCVCATLADSVTLIVYKDENSHQTTSYAMEPLEDNIWQVRLEGDLNGIFYTYCIKRGKYDFIAKDPYAYSSSVNSKRSCVVDIDGIFKHDSVNHIDLGIQDAIIYETHIRDFTLFTGDSVKHKGKYLGVVEGQEQDDRLAYLKTLGITHIHFLPLQDFASVDETDPNAYNWGYDPEHYFVPEGSYATNPQDPISRIVELKQMIDNMHKRGVGIILDVVYNHTFSSFWHSLDILAPDIYFRKNKDGHFSNGSGCGNELNTEHPITRHLILESLKHWMNVYGVDGFRFDLMGLIDIETMQIIVNTLKEDYPNIILYGEPWVAADSVLALEKRMLKGCQQGMALALFNDDYRTLLKGDSDGVTQGYIQGDTSHIHHVKTGMLGSIYYSEDHKSFSKSPFESINYITAHDNLCFYDKLKKSTDWDDEHIKKATKLGLSMIVLAFGVPFIQGGTEIMHTKSMDANAYKSGDQINGIKWNKLDEHKDIYTWLKALISFRKSMPCYQSFNEEMIVKHVRLLNHDKVVGLEIYQKEQARPYTMIMLNGSLETVDVHIKVKRHVNIILNSVGKSMRLSNICKLEAHQVVVMQQKKAFIDNRT